MMFVVKLSQYNQVRMFTVNLSEITVFLSPSNEQQKA